MLQCAHNAFMLILYLNNMQQMQKIFLRERIWICGRCISMDFDEQRESLVDSLIRKGYISNTKVINAMKKIQRHFFVPEHLKSAAYYDHPLQIGEGQTISAPHMVGIMLERLDLKEGQKVLEVGGGSGYHAALVAEIVGEAGHVYSIERIEILAERAKNNIKKSGLEKRVTIIVGDGSCGLKEHAPYDRIFITCAAPGIPQPLIDQLKDGGKLLIPSGSMYFQDLILCEKKGKKITKKNYGGCVFVPLIGEYGFH